VLNDLGFHLLTMPRPSEYAVTVVWQPTESIRNLVGQIVCAGTLRNPHTTFISRTSQVGKSLLTSKNQFVPGL